MVVNGRWWGTDGVKIVVWKPGGGGGGGGGNATLVDGGVVLS